MNSDESLPFCSPFPLHFAGVIPERPYANYQPQHCPLVFPNVCTAPTNCAYSFSSNYPGWNDSHLTYRQSPTCPRCYTWRFASNWCAGCGELLLGADCITNRATVHCEKTPLTNPTSCVPYVRLDEFPLSFFCSSSIHQHRYQTTGSPSDLPLNDVTRLVAEASLTNTPSPIPEFRQVFTNGESGLPFHDTQPWSQSHLAKTGVSSSGSQIESLRSGFNELDLQPDRLTMLEGLPSECLNRQCDNFSLATCGAEVYSVAIHSDPSVPRLSRQRCISGPAINSNWPTNYGFYSNQRNLEPIPATTQTAECNSFILPASSSSLPGNQFSTSPQNNWWSADREASRAYSPENFHPPFNSTQGVIRPSLVVDSTPTSCSFSQLKHFTRAHRKTRNNSHRLKYLSECPRTLSDTSVNLRNDTVPVSSTRSSIFDSDSYRQANSVVVTATSVDNNKSCNRQSSRPVLLTHCSSVAKTKPTSFHNTPIPNGPTSVKANRRNQALHPRGKTSRLENCGHKRRKNPLDGQIDHTLISNHSEDMKSRQACECLDCPVRESFPASDSSTIVEHSASATERIESPTNHPSSKDDGATQHATAESNSAIHTTSYWLRLPDELWLLIIRSLPLADRARLALVCRRLSILVVDRSLWRVIQLRRHQHLDNTALTSIGRLRPRELHLSYCHGNTIAGENLRQLFETCGSELRKLSFVGCTKGLFDGDLTLLLAAEHCPNLSHIDASYTQSVRDHTVITLAKSLPHLSSLKLNGARQISNFAIEQLVHYRENTLQRLELFGCFRLNSDIFTLLGRCQQLRALAFGHLYHLSSDGLLELVSKLPLLASLDLRGTQALANDSNLTRLADKCPHLEEVVLANMRSLKHEAGIAQMLRRLPRLRVLDLCGLAAVGDLTMEALATCCPYLEELDVSCTSITHKGLSYLIETPAKCLRCLRISRCREITEEVLEKLVQACSRLTLLYAYDFKSIKDWSFLQKLRPTILIESDC